jgi:hypothetical protein
MHQVQVSPWPSAQLCTQNSLAVLKLVRKIYKIRVNLTLKSDDIYRLGLFIPLGITAIRGECHKYHPASDVAQRSEYDTCLLE